MFTNFVKLSYYKVGHVLLLQSGAKVITKLFYYKVGQVLQSGAILLQSGAGITKWGNYYKVGHNRVKMVQTPHCMG